MAEPLVDRPREPAVRTKWIGRPFRRVDGSAKVLGRTLFVDDLSFPRMVHARLVRSTVAHARITAIDLEAARACSGVLSFLTGDDLEVPFGVLPVSQDELALCRERVRFVGDPVAAVAALSEDEAYAAALAVEVEYEPLPTVSDLEEALNPDSPALHDYGDGLEGGGGSVHKRVSMRFGAVEEGLADADLVLDETYFYSGSTHLPLEQHGAVAVPEDSDRVTLYSSTQTPHYVQRTLAKVLQIPQSKVRVVACSNGGGFGGKSDVFGHEIVVAALALKLGRPVKIVLTREEVFYCHRGRHPVLMRMRTGFDRRGRMVAQHLRTGLDGGAYGSYGVASTYYTGALQTLTYQLPRYRFDGLRVFTNKPPCGPKRGHGTPQPRFGLEVQLDEAAFELGLDPADIRLDNLTAAHSVTANWLKIGSSGLRRCIEAVLDGSGWRSRRGARAGHGGLPDGHGLGLACGSYLCGAGLPIYWNHMPQSAVQIRLDRSGLVTAYCGEIEIGQGSDSVLAAVVAEELGLAPQDIRLCVADTDLTPVDLGSYSSRVTLMVGQAAKEAARKAREQLASAVSEQLEVPVERLVFAEERVYDHDNADRSVSFAEAIWAAEARYGSLVVSGSYVPERSPGRYRGSGVGPSPAYSFTAAVVEVNVDRTTGEVEVEHVWIAHDVGRSINPTLVVGQVEGSVYMGLGEVLMEDQAFRRLPPHLSNALVHKGPSMLDYKSPTFLEMPPVTTYLIEDPDPAGPYGAKEVGQGPMLPIPPAVANGVFDAVGVRVRQVPIEPYHLLRAMEQKERGGEASVGPGPFPDVDFGETLVVRTPQEGGDGRAIDDWKSKLRSGMRSATGTMSERDAALEDKDSDSITSV
jgi:4-hydroxybenzoyl-CoA reductase alpha subunit